jgi:hypothetical protein
VDKERIAQLLTDEEKDAVAVLLAGGFMAMTECRISDVRELDTGRRRPTFRNQGRYDLVIGIKSMEGRALPERGDAGDPEKDLNPSMLPDVSAMSHPELLAEIRMYPQVEGVTELMDVDELREVLTEQRSGRRELLRRSFSLGGDGR